MQYPDEVESSLLSQILITPYFNTMPFEEQICVSKLKIPHSYSVVVPNLTGTLFKTFEPTILFYIFYNYPFDQVQIDSHNELVSRGWLLHK